MQRYGDDPEAIPGTKSVRKGIVRAYDSGTHKADVQIVGSHPTLIAGLRVATDIPAAAVVAGRQCTVLFLDPSNQDDALVLTIQGATPPAAGGGDDHAPVGGYYPGVLSTGVKTTPQVPYKGDGFTITELYCRVAVAPQSVAAKVKVRRNGTSMGEVTIAASSNTGSLGSLSVSVSDGDYFDIEITQVGTSPNEGSDLVWLCVP